jgi:hypothetical protein
MTSNILQLSLANRVETCTSRFLAFSQYGIQWQESFDIILKLAKPWIRRAQYNFRENRIQIMICDTHANTTFFELLQHRNYPFLPEDFIFVTDPPNK